MKNITVKKLFNKETLIVLLKIFLPGILFLFFLIIFSFRSNVYFGLLSRDVNAIHNAPPYIGVLSNIGILLWSFTVAILFFSYKLSSSLDRNKKQTRFLFFSGGLSLLMLIDDLFLMHEYFFPIYLDFPEWLFYIIYGLSVVLIFYCYFRIIMNSDYILFLTAFLLFAMSSFFSESYYYFGIKIPHPHILEDGTKFLGILSWFFYFTRTCYQYFASLIKRV